MLHGFVETVTKLRASGFEIPQGLTEEEFIVLMFCGDGRDRDPEDDLQRESTRPLMREAGLHNIDAGISLAKASWRSVMTPFAAASNRLAEFATDLGLLATEVECAYQLAARLRHALHAPPREKTLETARRVDALCDHILRRCSSREVSGAAPGTTAIREDHMRMLRAVVASGEDWIASRDLNVKGVTVTKTKWRLLNDLREHGFVEGRGRKWRSTESGRAKARRIGQR